MEEYKENIVSLQQSVSREYLEKEIPFHQTVMLDGEKIEVNNKWLLKLLYEVKKSKSEQDFEGKEDILKERLHVLSVELSGEKTRRVSSQHICSALDGILSRKEFIQPQVSPYLKKIQNAFALLGGVFMKVIEKIENFLQRVFSKVTVKEGILSKISFITVVVLGAALVFLLINFIIPRIKKIRVSPVKKTSLHIPETVSWEGLKAKAKENFVKGKISYAIHCLYLSLLLFLNEKRLLAYEESITNGEYLQMLKPFSSLYQKFKSLTTLFDEIWYGGKVTTQECYTAFCKNYEELCTDVGKHEAQNK